MRLISCHIENFGKLHELDIDFDPGERVIFEENGSMRGATDEGGTKSQAARSPLAGRRPVGGNHKPRRFRL